jgi:TP901 family phage tail tape measure protein
MAAGAQIASLYAKIGTDTSGLSAGLNSAKKDINGFGNNLANMGKQAAFLGAGLTAGLTLPILGVGKAALDMAMGYEKSMNLFQAVSGATADQMGQVAKKAKELGADMTLPATSAADAATAMTELAKAGLSVNDTLDASKGVLQLAAAGVLTEAQAAEIAANALNAFHLEGKEATRIADLLAAAANTSSAEVTDVAMSMQMAGSVFASAQIPIEDLITAIGEMANAGIKNSDAGTSLKQMLIALEAPSDKARKVMGGLGIAIYDAAGKMKPLRELIGIMTEKLSPLTQEARDYALSTIFGSDAVRAANIVMLGGVDAFDKMKEGVTKQGAAATLAGARMKGLAGAIEGLKSQIETVLLDVAEPFLGMLEGFARSIADLVPKIETIDPNIRNMALAFLGVLAVVGPLLLAFGAIAGAVAFLITPVGIAAIAIAGLAALFVALQSGTVDTSGLSEFGATLRRIGTAVGDVIMPQIEKFHAFFVENIIPLLHKVAGVIADTMIPWLVKMGQQFRVFTTTMSTLIGPAVQNVVRLFNWMADKVMMVMIAITGFIESQWEWISNIIAGVMLVIQGIIEVAWSIISGIITIALAVIGGNFDAAGEAWQSMYTGIWEGITKIFSGAIDIIINELRLAWELAKALTGEAWEGISNLITTVWDGIKANIASAINWIIDRINDLINRWNGLSFSTPEIDVGPWQFPSYYFGVPQVPTIPHVGGGGGSSAVAGNTTNYNMTVNTQAQSSTVIGDFQLLRAMSGA